MSRRRRINVGDRVLCHVWNPVKGEFGRLFEGAVEEVEGATFVVRPEGKGYTEPLQSKEIVAALPQGEK